MIPFNKIKMMNGLDQNNDIISTNKRYNHKTFNDYKTYNEYNRPVNKNNFVIHHKSNPIFSKCEIGDYVKFKSIKPEVKDKIRDNFYVEEKFSVYYGKVTDIDSPSMLGIIVDSNDKRIDYPTGITIKIDRRSVLQIYPSKIIKHITARIALKHLWKDLVFREIKTTKHEYKDLKYIQYHYVNDAGFVRNRRFNTLEEALSSVDPSHHKNITFQFNEYYGFTYDKAIRNNDKYFDREIFFSKKCYGELDFSDKHPTGDFLINERGFNDIPPRPGSLVCGLVENGEKGLFFRKWFVCSREFLLLWTMVCDSKDSSLRDNDGNIKNIEKLLYELDTNCYKPNLSLPIKERHDKYIFHNLERTALFYTNRYKKICNVLFGNLINSEDGKGTSYSEDFKDDLSPFQKRLVRNIMWMTRI